MEDKTLIKGPRGEDIYKEDWTDEWGNVTKDGKVLAACGEWFDINPWKSEEIANAPMDQWFSLDEVWILKGKPENLGKYWMNKSGEIKSEFISFSTRNIEIRIWKPTDFSINGKAYKKTKKYYIFDGINISVMYAIIFLKNDDPINKTIVDHINGDSLNNHHINLRWATLSENSKNVVRVKNNRKKQYYYAKYDDNYNLLEWIPTCNMDRYLKNRVCQAIKKSKYSIGETDGFKWERYSDLAKEYVEKYGLPNPNEWIESLDFPCLYANPNGCLLVKYGEEFSGVITVGGVCTADNYYMFRVNKGERSYQTSRLVYCICNRVSISSIESLEIDHFSGFSNNIENLFAKTHKENMNNPNTRKKMADIQSTEIVQLRVEDGKVIGEFLSQEAAARDLKVTTTNSISRSLKNSSYVSYGKYLWAYKGKETERYEDFLNNLPKKIPKQFWSLKENRKRFALECKSATDYCHKYEGAYNISKTIPGELLEFFKDKGYKEFIDYSIKENRKTAASKCTGRTDYSLKYNPAYSISRTISGELDEFFPKKVWDKKSCREEASNYKNISEFREHRRHSSYKVSKENGWLDEFFPKEKPLKDKFSRKEERQRVANLCRCRSEYNKNFSSAYNISLTISGELDEFFPKHGNCKTRK